MWSRKIRLEFWKDVWHSYKQSKMGILGLYILIIFILIAVLAPIITPYDPIDDKFLAESHAYPSFFSIFSNYSDMPRTKTTEIYPKIDGEGWSVSTKEQVQVFTDNRLIVRYSDPETCGEGELVLRHIIDYQSSKPKSFNIKGSVSIPILSSTECIIRINIYTPYNDVHLLWNYTLIEGEDSVNISFDSKGVSFESKRAMGLEWYGNIAEVIFSSKGRYYLELTLNFKALEEESMAELHINKFTFQIPGLLHGFLGSDHIGSDLFSQLIYGSRISLLIGVTASIISVSIGIFAGIIAGFFRGYIDEGTMRLVDLLLVIPFLPLLMVISGLFGRNIWNLIFLLGVLSWPGFARVVRAHVLQLKTSTFVEASRSMGASSFHIIKNHLIPNVMPYAYAALALAIPGFIITEAALSFLALGDPTTPSWGRMFYTANAFGAFRALAWWWIIPPGIMITLLSLSFVFIGYSLDEILNPRLRVRR